MNFRLRIILLTALPLIVSSLLLSGLFMRDRLTHGEKELVDRAQLLARQLAASAEFGLFSGNRDMIESLAGRLMAEADVRGVLVRDRFGNILVRLGDSAGLAAPARHGARLVVARQEVLRPATPLDDLYAAAGETTPSISPHLGEVTVLLGRERLDHESRWAIAAFSLVTVGLLALAIYLSMRYARRLGARLDEMSQVVGRIGRGELQARVAPHPNDPDMDHMGQGINLLADRIAEAQRNLQAKVEDATRELNDRRLDAERSSVAKSRFLAAASHDLRQPLHALGLFADQLARRPLKGEDRALVDRMVESTEALGELLDALLDISRLDAGAMAPKNAPFALSGLFRRLQSEFEELAVSQSLRLRVVPTEAWVDSDPALLERVLMNLLSNAIRYTETGSVMLVARRHGDAVRIEVRDSGPGIREDAQRLIFAEFVQLGNPERDRRKGLGLGLSIVQRMCGLLKAPYGVRSRPGAGSVFWVEVPRAQPGATYLTASKPVGAQDLAGKIVGVVEDDPLVLEGLSGQLRAWGCRVVAAETGADLIGMLARHALMPDALVCDQQLANRALGTEVVDQVRQRFRRRVPALIVSGNADRELQELARAADLPLLTKPVRPAKLRAALTSLLVQGDAEDEEAAVPGVGLEDEASARL